MRRKRRSTKRKRYRMGSVLTICLAYMNLFFFPLLIMFLVSFGKAQSNFVPAGIGFLAFAAYNLIGYLCRWKHIFCLFQSFDHQKMTPDDIDWDQVSKKDAYLVPGIFAAVGILLLVFTALK